MWIVQHRKWFYAISTLLLGSSLVALLLWGLVPGIDFKGGTLVEVAFETRPEESVVKSALEETGVTELVVRPAGENEYLIRTEALSEEKQNETLRTLTTLGGEVKRMNAIGPVLGKEAARKSLFAIVGVLVAILLFITFAFRHVSEPVSSWKYGAVTLFALFHDIIVPAGLFAYLGHFHGYEVDTLFVTALLVVLGFSVHDSIVVFDRVRENLRLAKEKREKVDFEVLVGKSVSETFVRSVNTSVTTLVALFILFILGGEATRTFALTLLVGITMGTYSSIFVGSPLLVTWEAFSRKKE